MGKVQECFKTEAELIKRVGIGGHYLSQRETRAFTRKEYIPVWPPSGTTMLEIARTEAFVILQNHNPPSLPAGVEDRVEFIVAEADRALSRPG